MLTRVVGFAAALANGPRTGAIPKQGLSGLQTCNDAKVLNLDHSWHYNWGVWPTSRDAGGNSLGSGSRVCDPPIASEFVPMIWGCWGNCTDFSNWPTLREDWKSVGVTHLLGFNEPDNVGQSNLSPKQAADYWPQLDDFASSFDPPLVLVGPGMTHWDETGGSAWLDQFLGNLSADIRGRVQFLAQHDYSGDAKGIVSRAEGAYQKYGRKVWLTEYSVGNTADRPRNDQFMKDSLPLLQSSDAIERFAWFSARNSPGSGWVNASCLLPPPSPDTPGWSKNGGHNCKNMHYLSQHGNLVDCQANTLADSHCAEPKTAIYQSGDVQNCYCSTTPQCNASVSSWQVWF